MSNSVITGRRVMVTGGAGFLGRVVCGLLADLQPSTLVVPRHNDSDLSEQSVVRQLFQETRPEVVIHLAAEVGGIGANRENPGRYFYANLIMGLNLIEAGRHIGVEKFVQVGTVCSYPKSAPIPFKESDLWNGYPDETNAPYGIAKKSLLTMLQAYRDQYGFKGIYLIPVNLYGPGDNFDPLTSHVIPALIRKCVAARDENATEVEVWGTGRATREFLYVDDAARAIVSATELYEGAEPVNLGSGEEMSIADLAALVAQLTRFGGELKWNREMPDGQPRRVLETSQARELFGFMAEVPLAEGLRRTIDWWNRNRAL